MLGGLKLEYTCANGMRNVIEFGDTVVAYWSLDANDRVSNRNENIPYHWREIRSGLVYAVAHERSIGDVLVLVVDLEGDEIHTACLMGFPAFERPLHFESADLTSVIQI